MTAVAAVLPIGSISGGTHAPSTGMQPRARSVRLRPARVTRCQADHARGGGRWVARHLRQDRERRLVCAFWLGCYSSFMA